MFKHLFFYRLKIMSKRKSILFWTFIFPIALAFFFNLAFSNLNKSEQFSVFNASVVDNTDYQNQENAQFKTLIETLSTGEDKIFTITSASEEECHDLLLEGKIIGYYLIKEGQINLIIKNNGIEQSIMKYIVDNYYQRLSVIKNILDFDPIALSDDIINLLSKNPEYFQDYKNSNMDETVIYFYTLIGMTCMYAGYFGINAICDIEANLSKRGARLNISPTHKMKNLLVNISVGFLIQLIESALLILFLSFVLGVSFGTQLPWIILILLAGNLAGISFGAFITLTNKKSEELKFGILTAFSMLCSFLAGMMVIEMKYLIHRYVPIIAYINPVTMITDGLYALYYYTTTERFMISLVSLLIFSLIMISGSYLILRRKKYDSI